MLELHEERVPVSLLLLRCMLLLLCCVRVGDAGMFRFTFPAEESALLA